MTAKKAPERPKSVRVGWVDFKIEYIHDDKWEKECPNHADDAGLMWGLEHKIYVRYSDDAAEQNIKETLLHEIVHAVWFVSYLTYKKPHEFLDFEEEIVRLSSGPLLAVLQDNPHVVKYLTG